jgi:mannose-6-phosphate isomerase-like protein (cupin superfamily)
MNGFELDRTFVHLGLGSTATPLPDFTWTAECLAAHDERFSADGDDGRIVCITAQSATWDTWERHPAGEELVVLLSGRVDVIQDLPEGPQTVELQPGQAMINPTGVWHTADVRESGAALFITPGRGTEHRPRR